MSRTNARPSRFPRTWVALGMVLAAAAGLGVRADEVIRFKNGHSLTVRSSRVEAETVFVVLPNGSEASFPRSIVKLTETGVVAAPASAPNVAVGFAGRAPRGADLMGSRRGQTLAAMGSAGSSSAKKAVAQGFLNSDGGRKPQTVGFSRWGSDAIGVPAASSEKAPVTSLANRPQRSAGTDDDTQSASGAPVTSGPGFASPELVNPADRSHGHN